MTSKELAEKLRTITEPRDGHTIEVIQIRRNAHKVRCSCGWSRPKPTDVARCVSSAERHLNRPPT